jgi:hypothetical protein
MDYILREIRKKGSFIYIYIGDTTRSGQSLNFHVCQGSLHATSQLAFPRCYVIFTKYTSSSISIYTKHFTIR